MYILFRTSFNNARSTSLLEINLSSLITEEIKGAALGVSAEHTISEMREKMIMRSKIRWMIKTRFSAVDFASLESKRL